jgi:hypothetical protein
VGSGDLTIVFQRLPKGFAQVIDEVELRSAITPHEALFKKVRIGAASMSEDRTMKWASTKTWSGILVGTISAERHANNWFFDLEIYSLKLKRIQNIRRSVSDIICRDITMWIEEKLAFAPDAPATNYKLQLEYRFNKSTGLLESSCFVPAGFRKSEMVSLAWSLPPLSPE